MIARKMLAASDYAYKELTEAVIGAAIEVHKEFGAGFLEKVYEQSLAIELRRREIRFERQRPILISYKGLPVGQYVADLVVDKKVICEIKAVENLAPEHEAQLLNYLKATGLRVGLLLNFGRTIIQVRRFAY